MTRLRFEIQSFWHAGSGRGDGAVADATVLRSRAGLPILPGRTVKGLLREACDLASRAGVMAPDKVTRWFGSPVAQATPDNREKKMEEARYRTEAGTLRVGSATLGEGWEAWAAGAASSNEAPRPELLFRTLTTTALRDGVALDHTLRTVEVAIPMTLHAHLDGLEEGDVELLRAALPFIRSLGSHRNRGLGRVVVSLEGGR